MYEIKVIIFTKILISGPFPPLFELLKNRTKKQSELFE